MVPVLETARLTLRAFTQEDIHPLHQIVSDPDVTRYLPLPDPWPRQKVEIWIARHIEHWNRCGFGWWAVEHRSDSRLAGWCGLRRLEETDEVEVLFLLGKEFWNKGFATEAAAASLRYGFETIHLAQIIALVLPGNLASQRVIEKLGMTLIGQKQYFEIDCLKYHQEFRNTT